MFLVILRLENKTKNETTKATHNEKLYNVYVAKHVRRKFYYVTVLLS